MCSSFSPLQFGAKPISCSPIKSQSCVQVKSFSSQESNSPVKEEVPTRVGFLGLGIMGAKPHKCREVYYDCLLHDAMSPFGTGQKANATPLSPWAQSNLAGCHQCTDVLNGRPFNGEVALPDCISMKHQQKDLRLALGLAESVSQPTPIAAAANELYKVAKSQGLSDDDFLAVIEASKAKLEQIKSVVSFGF